MFISTTTRACLSRASLAIGIALVIPSSVSHAAVTAVLGSAVVQPADVLPLCAAPLICPDFWDLRPTEGNAVIYGSRAALTDNTCLKSVDGARTFSNCPSNYPVTGIPRETDIPADGSILSLRLGETGVGRCTLDRSTDGGAVWTPINVAVGANLQCPGYLGGVGPQRNEVLRCIDVVCLVYVRDQATARLDLYRSSDNGQTWGLVSTGNAAGGCTQAAGIFFDGSTAVAGCWRNISGETSAARRSTDGGVNWTYINPPANLDYCGVPSQIQNFDTSYGFVCTNSAFTSFRLMSSIGTALTPSFQSVPTGSFSPFTDPFTFQLDADNIFMFMGTTLPACCNSTHMFKIYNGGQDVVEIPLSVAVGYPYQARAYQGSALVSFTSSIPHFALLKGN